MRQVCEPRTVIQELPVFILKSLLSSVGIIITTRRNTYRGLAMGQVR